jgi:hypothetical protein
MLQICALVALDDTTSLSSSAPAPPPPPRRPRGMVSPVPAAAARMPPPTPAMVCPGDRGGGVNRELMLAGRQRATKLISGENSETRCK